MEEERRGERDWRRRFVIELAQNRRRPGRWGEGVESEISRMFFSLHIRHFNRHLPSNELFFHRRHLNMAPTGSSSSFDLTALARMGVQWRLPGWVIPTCSCSSTRVPRRFSRWLSIYPPRASLFLVVPFLREKRYPVLTLDAFEGSFDRERSLRLLARSYSHRSAPARITSASPIGARICASTHSGSNESICRVQRIHRWSAPSGDSN